MEDVQNLNEALALIRSGLVNQGTEAWEESFCAGRGRDPTEALFLKSEYADTLSECGLVELAKRVDREICNELDQLDYEYDLTGYSPVSLRDRQKLEDQVRNRYADQSDEDVSEPGDDSGYVLARSRSETSQTFPPEEVSAETRQAISRYETRSQNYQGYPPDEPTSESRQPFPADLNIYVSEEKVQQQPQQTQNQDAEIDETAQSRAKERTRARTPKNDPSPTRLKPSAVPRVTAREVSWEQVDAQDDASAALLAALNPAIRDSPSWLLKFDLTNQQLERSVGRFRPEAVKIAILDTGCDLDELYFRGPGIYQADDVTAHWHDCLGLSAEPVDEDPNRHGTALAALLLRLAPRATVYVIRIAKDAKGLLEATAKERIATAISLAAGWGVHIVSMSFGFSSEIPAIRDAIVEAEKTRQGRILFFAAANNDGLNDLERFPAFFESVIAVRGTRHDGQFDAEYNPKTWSHKGGPQYGTLARDVPCGLLPGRLVKSGCSVATPIMAAIAAAVISFADAETRLAPADKELTQTRRGMLSVFRSMAEGQAPAAERMYLTLWQLLEHGPSPFLLIAYALAKLPRQG